VTYRSVADARKGRAVFLDRDGVLNRAVVRDGVPHPPASLDELEILPGVSEACERLRGAGFKLVVVTNQPDLRRGTQTLANVQAINDELKRRLALDDIRMCPHDDADLCSCRKPAPGMLLAAAGELDLSLRSSVMVGDRWRDVETGRRAGCKTVFVDRGYAEPRPAAPDLTVAELADAVPWILRALS
jgi:D-glycero-D-manno-heptose 1,7-bisphosphate phosphatase